MGTSIEVPCVMQEEYFDMQIQSEESFVVKEECVENKDMETQTDPILLECTLLSEVSKYKGLSQKLQQENQTLRRNLAEKDAELAFLTTSMNSLFTEGQLKKIRTPGRVNWNWKDISSAICVHASGPRAYKHLYAKGFSLPHVSTLHRWCSKIPMKEGILAASIDFMKQCTDLAAEERICVLAFDEMKVVETYEYDAVDDFVRKPAKFVQVVMARGLRKSWKQPVFYNYDCEMTQEILYEIISKLYDIGFLVVAVVCDMGSTNRKLFKHLGATTDKPWFPNPVNEHEKLFTFADVPHLMKLIRNHYLDTGLIVNHELLTPRTIEEVLKCTSKSDVSITFKLTDEHISVHGPGRQKVKLAAQVFSHTTANAISRCYSLGMDIYKAVESADFIQLVNDWFDVMNSTIHTFSYPGKEPYGLALEDQNQILDRMNEIMSKPIIPNKKSLDPFQKGIIMSNNALVMLYNYLKEKYNMSYILTNRLNQDVLDHFFGAIRSKGGLNDHPTPKEFRYRLRKYILARNTEHLSGTGNVENDPTEWLPLVHPLPNIREESLQLVLPDVEEDHELQIKAELDIVEDPGTEHFDDFGVFQEDALEYISGYIIRKLNVEEYQSHENSFTWVEQVSKGRLKKPSDHFLSGVKGLEAVFYKMNGSEISHCKRLRQRLVQEAKAVNLPEIVKNFFFKCRIHFRVRNLNTRLKVQKAKQRAMGYKKYLKIKLW